MGQKVARSVTLGLTGLILSAIGYEEAVHSQSPETQRALAWVFGFGVGSLFCLASFVFLRTPLDKKRQEKIQADKQARLAAMEGQGDATFSGQPLPRSEGLDLFEKDVGG
jgi:Na+/melibiose symporter-like transporter